MHFPKKLGQERPNSDAFSDDESGSMSVVIARGGRTPEDLLKGHEGYGLVSLSLETLTENGLELELDPLEDEPDHALVVGKKTDGCRKRLSKASNWEIKPPSVD